LKKELLRHLRQRRVMRGPKRPKRQEGGLPDVISIRERPAEVEDRAVPGHWEGDLIAGYRNQSFIGTLVERSTRFVKLIKVDSKDAADFAVALTREVLRLPPELRRTLTWDRGTEMARHRDFTFATNVKVYFCDPHSPWQRGSNENTNGLLRQYFPKGSRLDGLTQEELDLVAKQLNERPRQTLGWASPADALRKLITSREELATAS
jgi:IS30 family transposase